MKLESASLKMTTKSCSVASASTPLNTSHWTHTLIVVFLILLSVQDLCSCWECHRAYPLTLGRFSLIKALLAAVLPLQHDCWGVVSSLYKRSEQTMLQAFFSFCFCFVLVPLRGNLPPPAPLRRETCEGKYSESKAKAKLVCVILGWFRSQRDVLLGVHHNIAPKIIFI